MGSDLPTSRILPDKNNTPTVVGDERGLAAPGALDLLLESIFSSPDFIGFLKQQIAQKDLRISDQLELIRMLHDFFRENLGWDKPVLRENLAAALNDLATHEADTVESATGYSSNNRANPGAVFWPNPTHENGTSLKDMTPELGKIPLVAPETAIGSAGSCFAYEIAKTLQRWGFNYIIGEPEHDGSNGIFVDTYDARSSFVRFNATWGLIFNTPSLRQLAERAFGTKSLNRILVSTHSSSSGTFYTDPFREGVAFQSPDAYEKDYDRHTAACREVFSKVEVFIVTLGLNEVWEFKADGSILSNLPHRPEIFSLIRPKILTVEENVSELQKFLDLVRQHNPNFKLIVSLSPVPLKATFRRDQHVITANTHSKSVLRVAADEFVSRNDGVYYFPSYEYVMHCARDAWEPDERHVTEETVGDIMQMFRRMFVKEQDA